MAITPEVDESEATTGGSQVVDSKYRLIILAAKRSKQLQRGATPRIEIDPGKHKPTRIALEEVIRGRVTFNIKEQRSKFMPHE
jgi:DNA-directed RNA polymerase omega subunit